MAKLKCSAPTQNTAYHQPQTKNTSSMSSYKRFKFMAIKPKHTISNTCSSLRKGVVLRKNQYEIQETESK